MLLLLRLLVCLSPCLFLTGCGADDDADAARDSAAVSNGKNLLHQTTVDAEHWRAGESSGLPPYGYHAESAQFVWRSSWQEGADSIVLILGNTDAPNAPAPGQVAITLGGQPVLLASGFITPSNTDVLAVTAPLRIEKQHMDNAAAPLLLRKIDADGGQARFDMEATLPALTSWKRDVFWNAGVGVRIVDNLDFRMGVRGQCNFFWHLATTEPLVITQDKNRTLVEWPGAAMILQSSNPIEVIATQLESQTVLQVQTVGQPSALKLLTRIVPEEQ